MKLTDNQEKMDIVARLVKEGVIDFVEAVKLLEVDDVGGSGFYPIPYPINPHPDIAPWQTVPQQPWYDYYNPFRAICYGQLGDKVYEIPFPSTPIFFGEGHGLNGNAITVIAQS